MARASRRDVVATLRVPEAWGHLERASIAPTLAACDRVLAMLWRLTHESDRSRCRNRFRAGSGNRSRDGNGNRARNRYRLRPPAAQRERPEAIYALRAPYVLPG